jgi:hypothetical protein
MAGLPYCMAKFCAGPRTAAIPPGSNKKSWDAESASQPKPRRTHEVFNKVGRSVMGEQYLLCNMAQMGYADLANIAESRRIQTLLFRPILGLNGREGRR